MSDSEMEEYDFDYSEEETEEQDVDIENQYYNSKGLLESDASLQEALEGLQQVLEMESDDQERWRFKALKQIVKAHSRRGDSDATLRAYRDLLRASAAPSISRAAAEKKVNSTMDLLGASTDKALLRDVYAATLDALRDSPNARLWFKTNLKLAQLLFSEGRLDEAKIVLDDLYATCDESAGLSSSTSNDDHKSGSQLLEVTALLIQVHAARGDTAQLKLLYERANAVKSAIPHPRILGIIRECGGRVHIAARDWEAAATDFYEAFKSHDEAGSPARVRCLKYLVLVTMLLKSRVDPFDSQEARPYRTDPELAPITALAEAYQSNNIADFERVLANQRASLIEGDTLVSKHVEELRRNLRVAVVSRLVKPYARIPLTSIARELNMVSPAEAQPLLVAMILDGTLQGSIDEVHCVLELESSAAPAEDRAHYAAISQWADQLLALQTGLQSRLSGAGAPPAVAL